MAWGRLVVLLVSCAIGLAVACNGSPESGEPLGKGDHVIVDVDATTLPPQPDADLAPDSEFAPVPGSTMYGTQYDARALLTICEPPDGSTGGDSAAEAPADAADGVADGAPMATGCQPFPAACASEPNCPCLFGVFATQLPCAYPSCGVKNGFSLYCPP